jgi:hypothetical protein
MGLLATHLFQQPHVSATCRADTETGLSQATMADPDAPEA